MLTKILFTLVVIVIVALVFRVKTEKNKPAKPSVETPSKISAAFVAYTLLGLIAAISALVFVLHWQDQHEIISIQVTSGQGLTLDYQAYKKDLDGRQFKTVQGLSVDPADSDRIEILPEKN